MKLRQPPLSFGKPHTSSVDIGEVEAVGIAGSYVNLLVDMEVIDSTVVSFVIFSDLVESAAVVEIVVVLGFVESGMVEAVENSKLARVVETLADSEVVGWCVVDDDSEVV